MNHNLHLAFDAVLPGEAVIPMVSCHVYVRQMTGSRHGLGALSPECASFAELKEQVNRLKAELDVVLESGRKQFGSHELKLERLRSS
jgi:hypothetical protein